MEAIDNRDVFLNSIAGLKSSYINQTLSLIDEDHIHTSDKNVGCNVCNSLSKIIDDDFISAGARNQRIKPKRNNNDSQTPKKDLVPIDEVASTHDWNMRLRTDGDIIAKYLTTNKYDTSNFTIQDMLNVMNKLNIVRTDRNELFQLLSHVKSTLNNASISVKSTHPLVLIHSHANPRISNQLKELNRIYSPSNHHILLSTTRFQSIYFTDMSSSQDLAFIYKKPETNYYIHPIIMSLFGIKLPALENVFVYGDTHSLIKQLYEFRKVKSYNYMLLVNRLTEDNPIVITGIPDVISTEIQRANIHTMIRKAIMNIRMGIFYCADDDVIDTHLMKIIHTGCSQVMADEEQMLASILSIVGFRPTLVSVARPLTGISYDMRLQYAPYIVINPMKMITTSDSPISINSRDIYSMAFDSNSGRVVFAPPNIGYNRCSGITHVEPAGGNIFGSAMNSPVIVNGVLMFYVERRQNKNVFGGECYTGFRSLINDVPMDVSPEIMINGIMYRLKSAVCYKLGDQFFDCNTSDIFLKGHYTILFTELGPWMYDPLSIFNPAARNARLMRALKNQYKKLSMDSDDGFYDWLKGEGAAFAASKQQMLMNHIANFDDDLLTMEEAMSMISRHCCILIYAQDYDQYISAKHITELF
ncbi:p4b precursor of essential virion protein 4b [Murmansk poxvirus]|uniref:Virion core protein 4b n=1 Tax=Murmansk poxvirus TaxID=2025359 RepID=A0A223FMU0_9POXV|nr:p4b precursor of essential virion protein 4b [Murmansk poxvirus]AST09313.1 p4b precursor of essential virion protein 4b [Murmansk poxvirus]